MTFDASLKTAQILYFTMPLMWIFIYNSSLNSVNVIFIKSNTTCILFIYNLCQSDSFQET